MSAADLSARLNETSYEKLFLQGAAAQLLDRPGIEEELLQVALDSAVNQRTRVLAHELLVGAGHPVQNELAESYCQMLPGGFLHNWWGMPGQYIERLGRTMVAFGQAAAPCLTRLLDDQRPLGYVGSEEPSHSKDMQYRVCDLAAYLITNISNVAYEDSKQLGARDEFIATLRRGVLQ